MRSENVSGAPRPITVSLHRDFASSRRRVERSLTVLRAEVTERRRRGLRRARADEGAHCQQDKSKVLFDASSISTRLSPYLLLL